MFFSFFFNRVKQGRKRICMRYARICRYIPDPRNCQSYLQALLMCNSHGTEEEWRIKDGKAEDGDGNHPVHISGDYIGTARASCTNIPSSTRNSFSFCISGLPQPPAISGILLESAVWSSRAGCSLPIDTPHQDSRIGTDQGTNNEFDFGPAAAILILLLIQRPAAVAEKVDEKIEAQQSAC